MSATPRSYSESLQLNDIDRALAQSASRALSHLAGQGGGVHVDAVGEADRRKEGFALPAAAVQLMLDMLGQMAGVMPSRSCPSMRS